MHRFSLARRVSDFGVRIGLLSLIALICAGAVRAEDVPVYKDTHAPLEARVNDLFGRLTPDERLSLLTGTGFTSRGVERLGLPPVVMADAGQGVRGGMDSINGPATAFPAGVLLAAAWDPNIAHEVGAAIGVETQNKGTGAQVILGPGVNIHRTPLNGRFGEYYSEDPFLSAETAVGYIQGVQSTGAGACVKHFVGNNQEFDRGGVDVKVGERALREIYLPAFQAAVERGHVWTVMSSYNLVNGHHMSANWYLLTNVLKNEWGFDGTVMSDWGGVHETVGVVNAGNDLEMPGPGKLDHDAVAAGVAAGLISQAKVDDAVRRLLRTAIRVGLLDGPKTPDHSLVNSEAHKQLAYRAATAGMVLLKNQGGVLPIDPKKVHSIVLIGSRAKNWQIGVGGSAGVEPLSRVSPLDGIKARAGNDITVDYAPALDLKTEPVPTSALTPAGTPGAEHGLRAEFFANMNLQGTPQATRINPDIQDNWNDKNRPAGIPSQKFSVRWTGKITAPVTGNYTFLLTADDGSRMFIDDKPVIEHWRETTSSPIRGSINLVAGKSYTIRVEYFQDAGDALTHLDWIVPPTHALFQEAVAAARKSDMAIVVVGTEFEAENVDRDSMELPDLQGELIRKVAAANPNTVVVMNNGGPVLMADWITQAPAVLEAWFPGQQGGDALAAVLFGDINPSGKLPDTLAVRREDYPDYGNYPEDKNGVEQYKEGIYVGYRHFDKKSVKPVFPFGYGLSYTTFRYSGMKLSSPTLKPNGSVMVTANITNTGKRAGAEIVELYVHPRNPKIDRAVRELKGYSKLELQPGETKSVTFTLTPTALRYCDVKDKGWKSDAGTYDIELAASSRDIRLTAPLRLTGDYFQPIPGMGATNPFVAPHSLTTGRPATASSDKQGNLAKFATDGDAGTRWESDWSDPQWLAVDLGKPTQISRALLTWEKARAAAYQFQVSMDGKAWTTVYSADTPPGVYDAIRFAPVTARWVRVLGEKRNTDFGYSLYELNVYGKSEGH
ncbi:MAG: glycoside hydrolase family 3 C-terminal domain-containing protein [Armatimonadota bacterium]|nr:glycoside hydrolase family 3 C-terminal domain-containing protein [Armatimonadota bacterium]